MSSYTPNSIANPNQNVVLIPVKDETIAISNVEIADDDSGVIEIGQMKVYGYADADGGYTQEVEEHVVVVKPEEKTMDDYMFQFYMGSLTVVGLLLVFRFIQKT